MLLAPSDKRGRQCTCEPTICPLPFHLRPPLIYTLSAEHRVLILLDPSANAQVLDPNVLASGIR